MLARRWSVSSVEPAARNVVNTRDAEETFAYMIMLSANKLLGKWQKISFAGASIRVLLRANEKPA